MTANTAINGMQIERPGARVSATPASTSVSVTGDHCNAGCETARVIESRWSPLWAFQSILKSCRLPIRPLSLQSLSSDSIPCAHLHNILVLKQ